MKLGISIHAPRAGGDPPPAKGQDLIIKISIHAPRAGGDGIAIERSETKKEFQSTPPVRGATVKIRIFIRIFK